MRLIPRALARRLRPRSRPQADNSYPPFGGHMPWQSRWPSETDPEPECPEHAHALALCRRAINIETAANKAILADTRRDPGRDYRAEMDAAYQALDAYLIEHRAVLGTYPHWATGYAVIDGTHDPRPAR